MSSVLPFHESIAELQNSIRSSTRLHVVGQQTKSGFHSRSDSSTTLSTHRLQGIVSYDPQEFVVTVMAGTPVAELISLLRTHGQYMPFDPMLADRGATMGGTVASNCSGSCRFRFGGIRDFLIGVRFLDGAGNLIRGGGQVVKNAAGFDYPKLMVGSAGTLGLICELTFKVFPRPQMFATMIATIPNIRMVIEKVSELASSIMDLEAIDLFPVRLGSSDTDPTFFELAIRFGGLAEAIPNRIERLQSLLGNVRILLADEDEVFWNDASNLRWVKETESLVKLPTTLENVPIIETFLLPSPACSTLLRGWKRCLDCSTRFGFDRMSDTTRIAWHWASGSPK